MAGKKSRAMNVGGSALPQISGMEDSIVNADINVTPMVDVMLVLLIIFMVITPALAGYMAVLPDAVNSVSEKDDRVTLGIDTEGRYFIEPTPRPIPEAELATRLQEQYSFRPDDHVLYLKADRGVEYSVVLTAIDAAREAGVRRIGAITQAPAEGSQVERR